MIWLLLTASLAASTASSASAPDGWGAFARGPERNPRVAATAPDGRPLSVSWRFAATGAIPLDGPPLGGDLKTTAYAVGLPVGPSSAAGKLLFGSDAGRLYALDARTGAEVWSRQLWNMAMVNPLVVGETVYATTGNPYFNFAETLRFAAGERAVRGPGLNGLYALDLATGKERWHFFTAGEDMPTPVASGDSILLASGDGFAYAVDGKTGALRWKTDVRAIDGMSSPLLVDGRLFFGGSHPNLFLALDAGDGRILWQRGFAHGTRAGFGAATAAFGGGQVLVEELVKTGDPKAPVASRLFALDPKTGESRWERELGRGQQPKGFATATPVVQGDVVYVSSPVDGTVHALGVDGKPSWAAKVAGAGVGLVVGADAVYVAAGPRLVALGRADGTQLGEVTVGGQIGPAAPLLLGETLVVTNLYGWVVAVPTAAFSRR